MSDSCFNPLFEVFPEVDLLYYNRKPKIGIVLGPWDLLAIDPKYWKVQTRGYNRILYRVQENGILYSPLLYNIKEFRQIRLGMGQDYPVIGIEEVQRESRYLGVNSV